MSKILQSYCNLDNNRDFTKVTVDAVLEYFLIFLVYIFNILNRLN